jgi:hypothetical protein
MHGARFTRGVAVFFIVAQYVFRRPEFYSALVNATQPSAAELHSHLNVLIQFQRMWHRKRS